MATVESRPQSEKAEGVSGAPRIDLPVETWTEGDDTTRREVLEGRALAVEKMLTDGVPQTEQYAKVWQSTAQYIKGVKTGEITDEGLSGHLANERKAEAFRELLNYLREGKALMEVLGEEDHGPPNPSRLAAMDMLRQSLRGAAATDGGVIREQGELRSWNDLDGAEGEAMKRMLRMADIGATESMTIAIRQRVVPKNQMAAVRAATTARWENIRESTDVPEIVKTEWAREALFELRTDYEEASEQPKPVVPESAEREKKAIVVFGQEMIAQGDFTALKQEVLKLAREGTPESTYKLVRQLAHMKRAKVGVSRGFDKIRAHLDGQRDGVAQLGGKALAQFLTYQRYLDPETQVRDEEKQLILNDLDQRLANNDGDISAEIMNAQYLGVLGKPLPDKYRKAMAMRVAEMGELSRSNPDRAALELARAKATGLDVSVGEETQASLQTRLEALKDQGQWREYVRLYGRTARLGASESPANQEELSVVAEKVRETRSQGEYVYSVADLASLERQLNRPRAEEAVLVEPEVIVATEATPAEAMTESERLMAKAEAIPTRPEVIQPEVSAPAPRSAEAPMSYMEERRANAEILREAQRGWWSRFVSRFRSSPQSEQPLQSESTQSEGLPTQEQQPQKREWRSAKEKYSAQSAEDLAENFRVLGQQDVSERGSIAESAGEPGAGPIPAVERQGYQTPAERLRAERARGGFFSRLRQGITRWWRRGDGPTANDEYVARQFQQQATRGGAAEIETGPVEDQVQPERKPVPVDADAIEPAGGTVERPRLLLRNERREQIENSGDQVLLPGEEHLTESERQLLRQLEAIEYEGKTARAALEYGVERMDDEDDFIIITDDLDDLLKGKGVAREEAKRVLYKLKMAQVGAEEGMAGSDAEGGADIQQEEDEGSRELFRQAGLTESERRAWTQIEDFDGLGKPFEEDSLSTADREIRRMIETGEDFEWSGINLNLQQNDIDTDAAYRAVQKIMKAQGWNPETKQYE